MLKGIVRTKKFFQMVSNQSRTSFNHVKCDYFSNRSSNAMCMECMTRRLVFQWRKDFHSEKSNTDGRLRTSQVHVLFLQYENP